MTQKKEEKKFFTCNLFMDSPMHIKEIRKSKYQRKKKVVVDRDGSGMAV